MSISGSAEVQWEGVCCRDICENIRALYSGGSSFCASLGIARVVFVGVGSMS